ncbi:uncharacterized protein PV07_02870 [Cladophialophora immunda]|uniref:HTH OST-type domain-containing protein n=1 Tax=Cladophialophora immunda TaxID=569365 RepID=A0A0D2B0S4_9EURO|nr:uncharacterized protein PV07_02870 [Cladophialophora immunda]KIW31202.1 hypothetical protein PV07_02870 [Cladophialophora immunda]
MTTNNSNIALLIDGDNVSPKIIAGLMAEIANYGAASVRRIYGDWTNPSLKGWKGCLLNHSITPMQQFAYTTGKNSTDGAMIIDAMDLLYTGRFSAFCIVSSDSDFTRLATRIREQGVTVYGFGERKTNTAFIAACHEFIYFDVLHVEPEESLAAPQSTRTAMAPVLARTQLTPRPLDPAALQGLTLAVTNAPIYSDNWANLADVGSYLSKISPDLRPRNYGYERLRDFAEASGIVEWKWKNMGDKPPLVLVRLKRGARSQDGQLLDIGPDQVR